MKRPNTNDINEFCRKNFWLILLCVLLVTLLVAAIREEVTYKTLSYSELVTLIENDEVESVEFDIAANSNIVIASMRDETKLKVVIPSGEELSEVIRQSNSEGANVKYEVKKSFLARIAAAYDAIFAYFVAIWFLALLIIIPVGVTRARERDRGIEDSNDGGGQTRKYFGDKFRRKKAEKQEDDDGKSEDESDDENAEKPKSALDSVAGIDSQKESIMQIIDFLKNPEKYREIGAEVPKGVLLIGPPGTGKTLIAKAIAKEAKCSFYAMSGSDFEEKYVGVGAARVRKLFDKALRNAPSIIFIDEADSAFRTRYDNENNHTEQTTNQFLAKMDGFETTSGIIVIAATNHYDVLDPAFTRRFSRKIYIPMPDVTARHRILEVHAENKKFTEDVSLEQIAKKTVGFSGAELKDLLNEAAILAVSRGVEAIENEDIDEAIARAIVGIENKTHKMSMQEKYQTAVHEAGHAVAAEVENPAIENLGISIVPRGSAGGYNQLVDKEEKAYLTKEDAIAQIVIAYGGKAAEEAILNIVSTGPSSDLKKASQIAKDMVTKYAMGDKLLTVTGDKSFDSTMAEEQANRAEETCQAAYKKAQDIISLNKDILQKLADLLMDKEVLTEEEVKAFFKENKVRTASS